MANNNKCRKRLDDFKEKSQSTVALTLAESEKSEKRKKIDGKRDMRKMAKRRNQTWSLRLHLMILVYPLPSIHSSR